MPKIKRRGRPSSRTELASWYAEVLAEQESSGLGVVEYASMLGVTPTTLHQWRRRLSAGGDDGVRTVKRAEPTGLIQVSLAKETALTESEPLVVRVAGGRCVEVRPGFDDIALRRLLTVLEEC